MSNGKLLNLDGAPVSENTEKDSDEIMFQVIRTSNGEFKLVPVHQDMTSIENLNNLIQLVAGNVQVDVITYRILAQLRSIQAKMQEQVDLNRIIGDKNLRTH
jgi:hypothetical protein